MVEGAAQLEGLTGVQGIQGSPRNSEENKSFEGGELRTWVLQIKRYYMTFTIATEYESLKTHGENESELGHLNKNFLNSIIHTKNRHILSCTLLTRISFKR